MNNQRHQQSVQTSFERTAELFGVLSTPIRLRILEALCEGEKNVTHLLREIEVSQPSMSRHLKVLYSTGVIGKRRNGVQVFYRIADDSVVLVCKAVCSQVALEMKKGRRIQAG